MSISRVIAVVVLGVGVGAGLSVQAQEGPPGGAPPATRPARGPRGGGGAPMNLGGAMRDMGQMYKALMADGANPERRDDSLKSVANMERDAAVAKLNPPPTVQKLTGEEKAAKAEEYRTEIVGLQKALLSLEDAIAAKNADDVKKGLGSLDAIMKKGHGNFIPKQ